MDPKFVRLADTLPSSVSHDGTAQQSPYRHARAFIVNAGEWCPFLTCLDPDPHTHDACWLCETIRYGNAFCPACRAYWEPSVSVLALRLKERLN